VRPKMQKSISRAAMICATACVAVGLTATSGSATTKTEQTFGAWTVTCVTDNATKRCSMSQPRTAGPKKQVVFVWSVATNASKQLMNNLMVPASISVKDGIRVSVGAKPPVTVPYDVCAQGRCMATFPMDAATLQAMSTSPAANSNYVLASRKLMQVQVDLKDFPKAYEYFKSQLTQ
jgi:invasion protein IalB